MANSTTNIDTISTSQANKEATANAFFDAASQASTYGRRASTSSGLTWGYYGGNVVIAAGTTSQIANGTLTLTGSATCYIVAAKADGTVSFATNTTNWDNDSDYWRLYSVVTGTATVTSWVDHRCPGQYQGGGSGGGGGTVDTIVAGDGIIVDATDPANPEVSSDFGSTAGTVCEGDDSRLSDAREWSAATVSQTDAEAGTGTVRVAWTVQRVWQAIAAWWEGTLAANNSFGGTQTFTRMRETVASITGTTPAIGAGNGTIFTWELEGASTPTSGLSSGESCTVLITPGSNSISWTNFNVGDAGAPPLDNGKVTTVVCYRIGAASFVDFVRQH